MTLIEYIRSKNLPDDLMFTLFEIVRRDNVVEGLIDYIGEEFSEAYGAEDKISELECNLEQQEERVKELEQELEDSQNEIDKIEADAEKSYESFTKFVEEFIEKKDRHPSIDEAWEAAWESSK